MLRRVSRAIRLLLLALGTLLIAWIPFSWHYAPGVSYPPVVLYLGNGALEMEFGHPFPEPGLSFGVGGYSAESRRYSRGLWATYEENPPWGTTVSIPLWLLAAVCLAWPVTLFIVARRRRGRGFEVEAKAGGPPPPTATGADGEGGQPHAPDYGFARGDLVSVVTDDGFGVVKVLAVDEHGVHARLYVQRFARRPAGDLGALSIAPFGPEHKNPFSIGHVPLSHASFGGWAPQLIRRGEPVAEEELDGYRMWQEAEAGYF